MLLPNVASGGNPVTELALPAGSSRTSNRSRGPLRLTLIFTVTCVVALAAGQGVIALIHPAAVGSLGAVNVVGGETCQTGNADITSCVVSEYAPGKGAALAFTVRNEGPIPMTVESVQPIGVELVPLVALYPALPTDPNMLSWTESRPFEPIEVAPGQEATILMLGTMSADCGAVARTMMADSGRIIDHALLTVRWGILSREINLPFVSALEVRIPHDGACSRT